MKVPVALPTVKGDPLATPELSVRAGPNTFGAGIAQGIGDAASVLNDTTMQLKRENDSRKIVELASVATDTNNATMTELSKRTLLEAKGVTEEAKSAFEKTMADALASAENVTQRLLLSETLTKQNVAMLGSAREHEASQMDKYDQFNSDELVKAAKESVAIDPLNYDLAFNSKGTAAAAVGQRWAGKVSPEELASLRADAVSDVTAKQLDTLLSQNRNADFLVLYPQVKAELRGKDAERLASVATTTSDLNVDQALTNAFFAQNPEDEFAALTAVDEALDGEQQDRVSQRLKVRYAEVRGAAQRVQQENLDLMGEHYVKGGYHLSAVPADVLDFNAKHNPNAVISLRDHELQRANATPTIKTDPVSWRRWNFLTDAQKLDPKNDPLNFINVWNEADYQYAVRVVADIRKEAGGFKREKPTYTDAQVNKLVKQEFTKAYGDLDSQADEKRFATFDQLLRQRVEHYQSVNDGKMPPYEGPNSVTAYVAWSLAEGQRVGAGLWGDKKGRRFETFAKGEEFRPNDPTQPVSDPLDVVTTVPPEEEVKIIDSLERNGKPVTQENILKYWRLNPKSRKQAR